MQGDPGAAVFNRATDTLVNRTRALFSFDVRSQTEYGTLRSFVRAGWEWTTNDVNSGVGGSTNVAYLDRVFIQFAGFTFGKTQSFFDVPDIADMTYQTEYTRNNTGATGTPVFAYTAMLGNGVSATISAEDYTERRANVVGLTGATFTIGNDNGALNHGSEVPDIVGNLRVDQAWGSAQISGALHLNQATRYPTQVAGNTLQHPDEKWGWAVGAGILLKMPWDAKDTFAVAATYAQGATTYVWNVPGAFGTRSNAANLRQDGGISGGWLDDAYFDPIAANGGQLELPKSWNIQAGLQHYWTNSLRTSIWGSYSQYETNSASVDRIVCAARFNSGSGCADFGAWQVGSRTIWNPVTNLDIGLEVMYTKIQTALDGKVTSTPGAPGTGIGAGENGIPFNMNVQDNDVWSGVLRIQRNFWP